MVLITGLFLVGLQVLGGVKSDQNKKYKKLRKELLKSQGQDEKGEIDSSDEDSDSESALGLSTKDANKGSKDHVQVSTHVDSTTGFNQ